MENNQRLNTQGIRIKTFFEDFFSQINTKSLI